MRVLLPPTKSHAHIYWKHHLDTESGKDMENNEHVTCLTLNVKIKYDKNTVKNDKQRCLYNLTLNPNLVHHA